jgi:hypothetical protein
MIKIISEYTNLFMKYFYYVSLFNSIFLISGSTSLNLFKIKLLFSSSKTIFINDNFLISTKELISNF